MSSNINRRDLLKKGALLAGGLPFASSLLNEIAAKPKAPYIPASTSNAFLTDREIGLNAPPELKARLFANENPFGPSPKAKQAITEAMASSYQYPFMFSRDLSQK